MNKIWFIPAIAYEITSIVYAIHGNILFLVWSTGAALFVVTAYIDKGKESGRE